MIISIDSGSSQLKAFDGRQRVRFPSVCLELPYGHEPHPAAIGYGGGQWLVGLDALTYQRHPDQEPNRQRDFHGGHLQHVQICRALNELGVEGEIDLLVLSLPYLTARDEGVLAALRARHAHFDWAADGYQRHVTVKGMRVVPQGVGALWRYQHECEDLDDGRVLLVDIGACTTDIVVVQCAGGTWDFVRQACTSLQELSAYSFFEMWRRELTRLPGLAAHPWNYFELMARAEAGNLTWPHCGDSVDLAPSYYKATHTFSEQLRAAIIDECGQALYDRLDKIILTGGGAALVAATPPDATPRAPLGDRRAVKLDAWSNVIGQHHHEMGGQPDEQHQEQRAERPAETRALRLHPVTAR